MITLKSPAQLQRMREAGRVVAHTLQQVTEAARPGVSLAELDAVGAASIRTAKARPSFLQYHPTFAPRPFPAVLCLSVNDVIVHGIPDKRVLREGDILSIDCGAELDGYHGDAAVTLPIGLVDTAAKNLIATTQQALQAGINAAVIGCRLGDISHAIQTVGRHAGYGIPNGFGGHGVGTAMHEDPHLPNTGRPGRGLRLREGLVVAIEPMFLEGGHDGHRMLADGWAVATADGSRAAHFEHTIAITADGPVILTAP
jgi:methionyl aminopeptidase